jgi:hypothetical protein
MLLGECNCRRVFALEPRPESRRLAEGEMLGMKKGVTLGPRSGLRKLKARNGKGELGTRAGKNNVERSLYK